MKSPYLLAGGKLVGTLEPIRPGRVVANTQIVWADRVGALNEERDTGAGAAPVNSSANERGA